jgi:hypothetical protein
VVLRLLITKEFKSLFLTKHFPALSFYLFSLLNLKKNKELFPFDNIRPAKYHYFESEWSAGEEKIVDRDICKTGKFIKYISFWKHQTKCSPSIFFFWQNALVGSNCTITFTPISFTSFLLSRTLLERKKKWCSSYTHTHPVGLFETACLDTKSNKQNRKLHKNENETQHIQTLQQFSLAWEFLPMITK